MLEIKYNDNNKKYSISYKGKTKSFDTLEETIKYKEKKEYFSNYYKNNKNELKEYYKKYYKENKEGVRIKKVPLTEEERKKQKTFYTIRQQNCYKWLRDNYKDIFNEYINNYGEFKRDEK